MACCGSIPFVRFVLRHRAWVPGGWCNPDNLACTAYYGHFGAYLLNKRHAILTGIEATRQRDNLFATFGGDGRVFVRPDGCHKVFTGKVVDGVSFADAIAPARYDPETRVVIAEPRPIVRVAAGGRRRAGDRRESVYPRRQDRDCPRLSR